MERLTRQEWHAVIAGLERQIRYCWQAAVQAWDYNSPQYVPAWVERIEVAKSVYDRAFLWPLADEEMDEPEYQEPYEPIYQEPDSFYTYQSHQDSWE